MRKSQIKSTVLLISTLMAWSALGSEVDWSLELDAVLENIAVTPPARVEFREERHNPMLKEPMVLTGHLEYLGVGRLRKEIETPFAESFLVSEGRVVIERNGTTRTLSMNKSKYLLAMLGGVEAILAGQVDHLTSVFGYELSGTADSWSLQLDPLSTRVSKHLSRLIVTGDEHSVSSIRFELSGGEWHLMELFDAAPEPES